VTKDKLTVKRRTLGKPGGNEIVRDKSIPATKEVVWKELMTIPLVKRPAPAWPIKQDRTPTAVRLTFDSDVASAKIDLRLDGEKFLPAANAHEGFVSTSRLTPGEHVVTAQLTLPDGRQYQRPVPFHVDGAVTPAWTTSAGGAVQSHLVRTPDALYVTTMGNDLVSLDSATGKQLWKFTAEDAIFSTPAVAEGTIYFGSADHHVYAIDEKTHQPRWKHKTAGAVLAGPAVAKGIVCIASVDQTIYGLDAATGQPKWTVQGHNMFQSTTATDGQRFYVGGWDNAFRAIDAATGRVAWEKQIGKDKNGKISFYYSPAISSPALGGGNVYVTTNDGVLHAFNTTTGDEAWSHDGRKLGYSSPLYRDGRVYCAIGDEGRVFAVDAATGKQVWEYKGLPVIYDSSFAFANGRVFIGSVDGTFNALDAATGQLLWQYRLGPGHVFASPATDDERVYIASLSGRVTALPVK
jgi:outer membrane protein assembly factor BamB